jgi:hypothetical protein
VKNRVVNDFTHHDFVKGVTPATLIGTPTVSNEAIWLAGVASPVLQKGTDISTVLTNLIPFKYTRIVRHSHRFFSLEWKVTSCSTAAKGRVPMLQWNAVVSPKLGGLDAG